MTKINVENLVGKGITAKLIHPGATYSTYTEFARAAGYCDAIGEYKDELSSRLRGEIVKVLARGKHGRFNNLVYVVESASGERLLIAERGLEIIERRYKTEKRPAKVGERILITKAILSGSKYKNGDEGVVSKLYDKGGIRANIYGVEAVIYDREYEVINENGGEEMSKVKSLKEIVEQLESCGYKCEAGSLSMNVDFQLLKEFAGVGKSDVTAPKVLSPQQQRDEIVEKAKRDIDGLKANTFAGFYYKVPDPNLTMPWLCDADFIVNPEKRTVVALLKGCDSGKIRAKSIAKCAPNDCFNAHIGKAIALRRALGLPLPSEYLNAPDPTEVRVGDVITFPKSDGWYRKINYRVDSVKETKDNLTIVYDEIDKSSVGGTAHAVLKNDPIKLPIIDDSREKVTK
ncbi:hypothetical protein [Bacillus sp. JJ722]|uniref:hypothetical protein n=1 Tax=Bacillus sp. JJ722 TaxID=3122973 RepID=UPI002FFE175D